MNDSLEYDAFPVGKRVTSRLEIDDDDDQVSVPAERPHSGAIAPCDNIEDFELPRAGKAKPLPKDVKSQKNGEVLTTDSAILFMISERQKMDEDFARLRRENEELKRNIERQSAEMVDINFAAVRNGQIDVDQTKSKWEVEKLKVQCQILEKQLKESQRASNSQNSVPIVSNVPILPTVALPPAIPPPYLPHQNANSTSSRTEILQSAQSWGESELPMLLWNGGLVLKIPFNGKGAPEPRVLMIKRSTRPTQYSKPVHVVGPNGLLTSGEPSDSSQYIAYPATLIWYNSDKPGELNNPRELILYDGTHIVTGHSTAAFWKLANRQSVALPPPEVCFSVVSSSRTLDLATENMQQAEHWKQALHHLLVMINPNKPWAVKNLLRPKPVWSNDTLTQTSYGNDQEHAFMPPAPPGVTTQSSASKFASKQQRKVGKDEAQEQLFQAAEAGNYALLEGILKSGISVNFPHPVSKDTVLIVACTRGHDALVKLCLQYGAKNDPHPDFGHTALHAAVIAAQYQCALVLLQTAAMSQADAVISNLTDQRGQAPLHMAAALNKSEKLVELLLSHGADLTRTDDLLQNPCHICAAVGNKTTLAMLLDHGGDCIMEDPDYLGQTCLHIAAQSGHIGCVRLLLETAASVSARNRQGQTPYAVASARGHHQIGLLLLEYQKDLPVPLNDGLRSRQNSSSSSSINILSSWADRVETKDPEGYSVNVRSISEAPPLPPSLLHPANIHDLAGSTYLRRGSSDGSLLPRPHTTGSSPQTGGSSKSLPVKSTIQGSPQYTAQFSPPASPMSSLGTSHSSNFAQPFQVQTTADASSRPTSVTTMLFEGLQVNRPAANQLPGYANVLLPPHQGGIQLALNTPMKPVTSNSNMTMTSYSPIPNNYTHDAGSGTSQVFSPQQDMTFFSPHKTPHKEQYNQAILTPQHQYYAVESATAQSVEKKYPVEPPAVHQHHNYSQPDTQYQNYSEYPPQDYYYSQGQAEEQCADQSQVQTTEALEIFQALGITWHKYMTAEGDIYYLDEATSHSQWDDPRDKGILTYGEEIPLYDNQTGQDIEAKSVSQSPAWRSGTNTPTNCRSPMKSPAAYRSHQHTDITHAMPDYDQQTSTSHTPVKKSQSKTTSPVVAKDQRRRALAHDHVKDYIHIAEKLQVDSSSSGDECHQDNTDNNESYCEDSNVMVKTGKSSGHGGLSRWRGRGDQLDGSHSANLQDSQQDTANTNNHTGGNSNQQGSLFAHPRELTTHKSSKRLMKIVPSAAEQLSLQLEAYSDFDTDRGGYSEQSDWDGEVKVKFPTGPTRSSFIPSDKTKLDKRMRPSGTSPLSQGHASLQRSEAPKFADSKESALESKNGIEGKALIVKQISLTELSDDDKSATTAQSTEDPGQSKAGVNENTSRNSAASAISGLFAARNHGAKQSLGGDPTSASMASQSKSDSDINQIQDQLTSSEIADSKTVAVHAYHTPVKDIPALPCAAAHKQVSIGSDSKDIAPLQNSAAGDAKTVKEDINALKSDEFVGKYAKMSCMGVPVGSIQAKMKMDGLDIDQTNRILRALDMPLLNAMPIAVPNAAAPNLVEKEDIKLMKDDLIVGKYAKMACMGVPGGNIQAKMKLDGIEVQQANRILRALDMELLAEAKAIDPVVVTCAITPQIKEDINVLKQDPIVGKYAKMSCMGVPVGSIQAKMKLDELDQSQVNRILISLDLPVVEAKPISLPANIVIPKEDIQALKQDPIVGKYAKMSCMGVPLGNIQAKMKLDNLEQSQVNRILRSLDVEIPGDNVAEAISDCADAKITRRPSVPLVKLHWNTIPADKLQNSIWSTSASVSCSNDLDDPINGIDIDELEKIFRVDNSSSSKLSKPNGAGAGGGAGKESTQLFVLEGRRAQNIVIGLQQYKSLGSHIDLCKAICSLDDMNGNLKIDHLENLSSLLPTPTELKKISVLANSKHPAEMFVKVAAAFYPDLPRRLQCFVTSTYFNNNCAVFVDKANLLIQACVEVLTSEKLAKLLQRMLAVGNAMNDSSNRTKAVGFSLDSLLKIVNTKGADKKTSVMDYVVKSLVDKGDELQVLRVPQDLTVVCSGAASKSSSKEVIRDVESIEKCFASLQQELTRSQDKLNNPVMGIMSPTAKNMASSFARRLEALLVDCNARLGQAIGVRDNLTQKVEDVIAYFGEDPSRCDTTIIFGVLGELCRALTASKDLYERKEKSRLRQVASTK